MSIIRNQMESQVAIIHNKIESKIAIIHNNSGIFTYFFGLLLMENTVISMNIFPRSGDNNTPR
jgi:succinate dehydrogenase/fumarate reductase cytochrome b subunit